MLLFILLPIYFGWKIIKNKQKLEEEDFKVIYGGFYDAFRTDCNWSILFNQFFLLRRLILAAVVIFCGSSPYF